MSHRNGNKTLIGMGEIIEYMNVSRPTFYDFVKMGLPARIINNRWYAHQDNIDEFFRTITRCKVKEIPQDAD